VVASHHNVVRFVVQSRQIGDPEGPVECDILSTGSIDLSHAATIGVIQWLPVIE